VSNRARGKRERFLALRFWLLKSPAWRSLPSNARAIYIEIAARYYGTNNGRISYSVRQAAEALHISKPTACRMLKLLQERGFIVCTKRGAFSRKTVREASEWRLTEHNSDYPVAHATKEFMSWKPQEEPREN
jgi:DNA-binding transcriptional MocR family regulator